MFYGSRDHFEMQKPVAVQKAIAYTDLLATVRFTVYTRTLYPMDILSNA